MGVWPSALAELAWLLNLLAQTARYAEPALAELDASLVPGIRRLRQPILERTRRLWSDGLSGCPELMYAACLADCVSDEVPHRLLAWLATPRKASTVGFAMLTEPQADRPAIAARLRRILDEPRVAHDYSAILAQLWQLASGPWGRAGRAAAVDACAVWRMKLATGIPIEELVQPRHPLTRADQSGVDDVFTNRNTFAVSPLYFCMSGGYVIDFDEYVHIAVPASDLLPVRRVRDAAFVADRLGVLAEPTRVRILIQLLSGPSGVMELARAMRISQSTVSGHLKTLREAGLIQSRRDGTRTVLVASRKRIECLLEDARATLARWD